MASSKIPEKKYELQYNNNTKHELYYPLRGCNVFKKKIATFFMKATLPCNRKLQTVLWVLTREDHYQCDGTDGLTSPSNLRVIFLTDIQCSLERYNRTYTDKQNAIFISMR